VIDSRIGRRVGASCQEGADDEGAGKLFGIRDPVGGDQQKAD
jgi:hypothetical protein